MHSKKSYTKISTSEVDEKEDHPVLVVQHQPLPQQVHQGVAVGCEPNNQLGRVEGDGDHIGGGEEHARGSCPPATLLVGCYSSLDSVDGSG